MKLKLSRSLSLLAATAFATGAFFYPAQDAQAQYPDRPVKLIVGFAPGGTNDILARIISVKLQDKMKQPFVVENKPGANSIVAAEYSAKQKPDGYTLFVASSGALTINPALYGKLPYDPAKDFEPIALLASFPLVVTVNADSPYKNIKEFVDGAKKAGSNSLNHAVGSSTFQLAAELFAREAGFKLTHVPYKGSGPAVVSLLSTETQVSVLDIGAVLPQIKAGKLRGLAVTTPKRSSSLPDLPTVAESGLPGYEATIFTGLVAPKGTPPEVLNNVKAALKDVLADKDVVRQIQALGMEPGNIDSAAFGKRIVGDIAKWSSIARSANIKAD